MQKTANLQLNKPDYSDVADIADINANMDIIDEQIAEKADNTHTHTKSDITDLPITLKNPTALTINFNGALNTTYDGSVAKTVNITPSSIGAAASSHTHSNATSSTSGFMSADDKAKLDGIETEATKITVDSSLNDTSTNPVENKVINEALKEKANTSSTIPFYSGGNINANVFNITMDRVLNDGDLFWLKFSNDYSAGGSAIIFSVKTSDGENVGTGSLYKNDGSTLLNVSSANLYLTEYSKPTSTANIAFKVLGCLSALE